MHQRKQRQNAHSFIQGRGAHAAHPKRVAHTTHSVYEVVSVFTDRFGGNGTLPFPT